ncbi:AAA family ATPase [Psychrobacter piscatorii]|uniref:AAA family ATPase n=1 Tax=Psychrobacter piscatorii TaxID=554343 RepID=UPI001918B704|nr:AAA family ATPase [Psychrobacter piscatorii]
MRLIELRLKNLNSLKGEWHIDFADTAFTNEGIFAITGQTGAGKTTILDAICLALYSYTPRLGKITGAYNEIMTQGAGECSAEVVIEINSKKYRCSWYQHRAHKKAKGNLLPIKHEVSDAETGKMLEDGKSKTAPYIQNLLGMDFDQFTRSIMLAQGSFAAFLKSDIGDRAAILEKITGTSIYAQISLNVHDKKRTEEEILNKLQYGLDGLALLDTEEEGKLRTDLQSYQNTQSTQQREIQNLVEKIKWLDSITESKERLNTYQNDLAQAQQAQQDFIPNAKRLTAANKALEIDSQFGELSSTRKHVGELNREKAQLEYDLPKQQALTQSARTQLEKQITQRQDAENAMQIARPKIQKARDLDNEIAQQRRALNDTLVRHDTLQADTEQLLENIIAQKSIAIEKENQSAQLTEKLTSTDNLSYLDGDIAIFDEKCSRLKAVIRQNPVLSQDKIRQTRELEEHKTALVVQQQRQQAQSDKNEATQEQLTALKKVQSELIQAQSVIQMRETQEQIDSTNQQLDQLRFHDQQRRDLNAQVTKIMSHIEQLESEISGYEELITTKKANLKNTQEKRQDKSDQLQLQQKVMALENYIADLQDGKPCPLCGALEHPYSQNHPHLLPNDENFQLAQYISVLDEQIAALNKSITAQQIEQASKRSTLESKSNQQAELNAQIQQHDTAITELLYVISQQMNDENVADSTIANLIQTLLALGSDNDIAQTLADSKDKLNQYRKEIADTLERYESYGEDITRMRETLETASKDQQALVNDISEQKTHITISENNITGIDNKITENFSELQTLITTILQRINPYAASSYPTKALSTLQRAPDNLQMLSASITQQIVLSDADYDSYLEELRQQRRALVQLKDAFAEDKDKQQTIQTDLERIKAYIENKEAQLKKDTDTLNSLIQAKNKQTAALTQSQNERAEVFEAADLEAAERTLRDTLDQAQETHSVAQRQLDTETYNLQQLIKQQENLASRIETATQTLETQHTAFDNALAASSFDTEAEFLAARLPMDERNALKQQQERIDYALQQAQSLLKETEKALEDKQVNPLTTDDKETLIQQQAQVQEKFNSCIESIGAISQRLKDNEDKKSTQQLQIDAINAQKDKLQVWQQLHKLIGSSDGKKYRTFAQGLTFDLMVNHANTQLQKMSDRYLLARDDNSPLELNVIDNYQGGEIRSTKNLSGGEGFIISLALALGLSQMASQNIRVDSLFLDEGFGTLDEESLDIALDTLTNLQQEGKLIGVISHVQALKDRILTQIKVEKLSGGFSQISGQGCHKVVSEKAS